MRILRLMKILLVRDDRSCMHEARRNVCIWKKRPAISTAHNFAAAPIDTSVANSHRTMPLATVSLALQALARSVTPSAAFAPSFRPSRGQTARSSLVRCPSGLGYRSQVMPDASLVDVDNGARSPSHSTIAAPVVATESEEQDANDFDWFKAWHPLLPVEILDREKPIPIELLGMKLVVYNDGAVVNEEGSETGFGPKGDRPTNSRRAEGTWRVFADVCPHRR